MKSVIKLLVLKFFIILFAFAFLTQCGNEGSQKNVLDYQLKDDQLTITLPLQDPEISQDNEGYVSFSGKDLQYLSKGGEPALPYQVFQILLPHDTSIESVSISLEDIQVEKLSENFEVRPVPPAVTWKNGKEVKIWPEGKNIIDGRDQDVYGENATFPESPAGLTHTGQMRSFKISQIPVCLVQYNPVTKKLSRVKSAKAVIRFDRSADSESEVNMPDPVGEKWVKNVVINFQEMISDYDSGHTSALSKGGALGYVGYVIITTDNIYDPSYAETYIDTFKAHKETQGFTVHIVTETKCDTGGSGWTGGAGDTAAENIRTWLQSEDVPKNIEYVLLIGNPDPASDSASGGVPMKVLLPTTVLVPSDYYYCDLTGNWDIDNDKKYGEWNDDFKPGGVDRFPEVLVGRIPHYPGDLATDLRDILEKIKTYDNEPVADTTWRKRVLLPFKPLITNSDYTFMDAEPIKDDILVPNDWHYHRVYEQSYGLEPEPETYPCTFASVLTEWTSKPYGAVFWSTHGNYEKAVDVMNTANAASLDDSHPSFIYSASCQNALPERSDNLAYTLLKNGGIAVIASTRDGWVILPNSMREMEYQFASRFIANGDSAGRALNDLRNNVMPTGGGDWEIFAISNIYGDPSLKILNGNPPCVKIIDPTGHSHSFETETGSIVVKAPAGCSWSAVSNNSWITVTSGSSGNGNGLVEYYVSPNTSGVERKGTITIADETFRITQKMFVPVSSVVLPETTDGKCTWADFDNDGYLDILLIGKSDPNRIADIYKNNGNGTFTKINSGLTGVSSGSTALGDYNNDGYLDILLTGYSSGGRISRIYRNNWDLTFTDISAGLTIVNYGAVAWGDYDNDGDLDILLTGKITPTSWTSKIYNNDNGTFSDISAGLPAVFEGSVAWGDYDNDGDLDILLTGSISDPQNNSISRIYNNNNGTFSDISAGLPGIKQGSVAWGDYDNDGDLDILLSGYTPASPYLITEIYKNDSGSFASISAGLKGVNLSSVDFGDYDNDGDLDILLTGKSLQSQIRIWHSILYENNSGSFTEADAKLIGIKEGDAQWGDYDNDGDLDILLTGRCLGDGSLTGGNGGSITRIYKNTAPSSPNTIPDPPAFMDATVSGSEALLRWGSGYDNETGTDGLSYNIYLGSIPFGIDKKSPHSSRSTGYRRIVQTGNVNQSDHWTIKNLTSGRYYWSIQSVDTAFAGSAFSPQYEFVIEIFNKFNNQYSGKLLTVTNNSDYALVVCQGENPSWTSQDWSIEYISSDEVRLKNKWTGRYLTATSLWSYSDVACQPLNTGWSSQIWIVERCWDGTKFNWRLKNKWSGLYLTVTSQNEYASIKCQYLNTDWSSQLWHVE